MDIENAYNIIYSDRNFERAELFHALQKHFTINEVLYPGCAVHIAPSFYFRSVTYIDKSEEAEKFFAEKKEVTVLINDRKIYSQQPFFQFIHSDYNQPLPLRENSFDLLISLYAWFVSISCKKYLKKGGLFLANDSFGEASLAFMDTDFELISVLHLKKDKYHLSDNNPEQYFTPKRKTVITREMLLKSGKGIEYQKSADAYLFRKL